MSNDRVWQDIFLERQRQDGNWGEQNHHPLCWLAILQEEVGEAAKACLERDGSGYQDEMVQVAAVAIAALENLARQGETEWWKREASDE